MNLRIVKQNHNCEAIENRRFWLRGYSASTTWQNIRVTLNPRFSILLIWDETVIKAKNI